MKKKAILFDKSGNRDWPEFLGGVKICKVDSISKLVSYKPEDVLLYVIHWTDFKDSNDASNKGQFRQSNFQNVLWYSGEVATIPCPLPGHTYNINVPHGIKKNDKFFNLLIKLINGINIHGIKEFIWNVLYPPNTNISDKQQADDIVNGYLHKIEKRPLLVIKRAKEFNDQNGKETYVKLKKTFNDKALLEAGRKELQNISTKLEGMDFGLTDYPVLNELEEQFNLLNNINFPEEYPKNEYKRKDIIGKVRKVLDACQLIKKLGGGTASYGRTKEN